MKHPSEFVRHGLRPPRWGFMRGWATVTQAVGLGWHRDATLWRKRIVRRRRAKASRELDELLTRGVNDKVGTTGKGTYYQRAKKRLKRLIPVNRAK